MIDRKNDYYQIRNLHLPLFDLRGFHRGTLIDGELVNDTISDGRKILRYMMFDCMVQSKEILLTKTLDKRIGALQIYVYSPHRKFLRSEPAAASRQPFEVGFKAMDKPYGLDMMFHEKIPNLQHGNDGLIFTLKDAPYTMGTDRNILKWKPPHENSIDFRLRLGDFPIIPGSENSRDGVEYDYHAKPTFDLLVFNGGRDYDFFAPLYLTDEEWEAMKRIEQRLDGRIIECFLDEHKRWRYKREHDNSPRFRDDKTEANHVSTVRSVLQSIRDGVSQRDLLEAADEIKRGWKRRNPDENNRR